MPVEYEQLRERAKPWMDPIPGPSPVGVSAKLEPAYQAVANEMAKLDMPSGGAIDWKKMVDASGELLRSKTKDLVIASYLAHSLHLSKGLDGLTTGVVVLAELVDRLWDSFFPERLRGRANAMAWFLEKTSLALPSGELAASELPKVEALEVTVKRLQQLVRERFADAAPALGPLLERIERMRLSIPVPEQPPPPPQAAPPTQSDASAAPQPQQPSPPTTSTAQGTTGASLPAPNLGGPASGADATEFLRNVGSALIGAASTLRQANAADSISYRILRIGLWLHLSTPPAATGGKTQLPPLPEPLRERLGLMAQNQKWAALLEECESSVQQYRFALDLHRMSWQALAGLGGAYEQARQGLVVELRSLVSRMPQLPTFSFSDGSPFADPQTRTWIAEEVTKQGDAGPARKSGGAEGGAATARLEEAKKLLGSNQAAEALALLQSGVLTARGGRERFLARLELARLAAGAGLMAIAKAIYEELGEEAAANGLDGWEPEVVAECLKGLITCARALAKDPRGAVPDLTVHYKRLCRLDPSAAHEVWP